jgi:hypothetical protein
MRASSVRATAYVIVRSGHQAAQCNSLEIASSQGVRKPPIEGPAHQCCQDLTQHPRTHSTRLVAQLNGTGGVVDDPLQWILQRKKGTPRKKNSGWRSRSFCRTREALLRCVREYCGEVNVDCLAELQALPNWHPVGRTAK